MAEDAALRVDPSNVEQLGAWDGDEGAFWAERADRFDDGVAAYRERFFAAAAIGATDTVLDVGCGAGQTTRDAARVASSGSVVGVDLSSRQVALARERAVREGVGNVTFLRADAQVHPFPAGRFDVAISRHGVMFFGDPVAAFTNVARALRVGGRLVLLTWQPSDRNEWVSAFRAAFAAGRELPVRSPRPGSLSDPDEVRGLLGSAGFVDVAVTGVRAPMYFGRDVEDACGFVSDQFGWMMDGLGVDARARVLAGLRDDMAGHRTDRGVFYGSAAWLIEARRG